MKKTLMIAAAICLVSGGQAALASEEGGKLFKTKCAMCHDLEKKKMGPALKSFNTDPEALHMVILDGRKMMPKFKGKLSDEQINAVVKYIRAQVR